MPIQYRKIAMICGLLILGMTQREAVASEWKIIPEESTIQFTATQGSTPIQGKFNTFDAQIFFDPAQLAKSYVKATIDLKSVDTVYDMVETELRNEKWFDVARFPLATFESKNFKSVAKNQYEAEGNMTLHGVSRSIVLPFTIEMTKKNNQVHANMNSEFTLKRTRFNVGQNEWKKTDVVGDDVTVEIRLIAQKL